MNKEKIQLTISAINKLRTEKLGAITSGTASLAIKKIGPLISESSALAKIARIREAFDHLQAGGPIAH